MAWDWGPASEVGLVLWDRALSLWGLPRLLVISVRVELTPGHPFGVRSIGLGEIFHREGGFSGVVGNMPILFFKM